MTVRTVTPREVRELVQQLFLVHGLAAQGWRFGWDKRLRRVGCCYYGPKLITLSIHYVRHNADKPDEIKDTILHEIAHALAGHAAAHGPAWRAVCRKIGARPQPCTSSDVEMPKGNWRADCGGCGKAYHLYRRPKTGTGRYHYCKACGKERGRLTFAFCPPVVPERTQPSLF